VPRIRFARRARDDLLDIWRAIAADNPAAADRVYDRLFRSFMLLERFPGAGRRRPEIADAARSLVERPYVILYRLEPAGVQIVRVVHGARDLAGTGFDEPGEPEAQSPGGDE
jgi:toxin ParE1/3/4